MIRINKWNSMWCKIHIINMRYQNWSILEYYISTFCIFPSDIPKAWLWSYCITRLHHILQFDLKMTKAIQTIDYVTVTRLFMLLFTNRNLISNIVMNFSRTYQNAIFEELNFWRCLIVEFHQKANQNGSGLELLKLEYPEKMKIIWSMM